MSDIKIGGFYVCETPCPALAITGDNEEYGYVSACYALGQIVEVIEILGSRAVCRNDKLMLIQLDYLC